jgi:protoporphyrinogen/coproporphyrinogen III oxidase
MKKVAIVGGGITGLTVALQLQKAGFNPLVYDAAPQAGGVISTGNRDGFRFEAGPNSLQENNREIGRLIEMLNLQAEVIEANPEAKRRYIVRGGKPVAAPSSLPSFVKTPLLSAGGKIRLFKEPFVKPAPKEQEESMADFTRRRLGQEALDYLVNPFVAGIFAGDPGRLSVRYAFPRIHEMERKNGSLFRGMMAAGKTRKSKGLPKSRLISFRTGLARLTEKAAEQLDKHIYHETVVESVQAKNGGWELIASRFGRRLRDTYDAVVFALPPDALAALKIERHDSAIGLPSLKEILQPPVTTLALGFRREQIQHPLDGFGMLIPAKEQRNILGALFSSTLFPDRAPEGHVLLTLFIGGMRQPEVANLDDRALVQHAMKDLQELLGASGEPVFTHIHRWPRAIAQYEIGHGRFIRDIDSFEQDNPGLFVAGTSRDGISVGQCIASGFRHAARVERHLAARGKIQAPRQAEG